jgi:hypothetical protein
MARWSDAIQLQQYYHWKRELNHPGVYEIGFAIAGTFNPMYIGKASDTIYTRLKKHWNQAGSKSVAEYYEQKKRRAQRDMLYFHFIVTENYDAMEANMLNRHGIGRDGGQYEWNRRYESSPW